VFSYFKKTVLILLVTEQPVSEKQKNDAEILCQLLYESGI